jgi:hypothetical protein
MDNRVYYGEYSLKHWIDLILKENIILPGYQRHFVWDESKVKTLIETFKNKQFVPPVTIGAYKNDDSNQNLILDGQQRLTSILLAYLGLYPNEKHYTEKIERFADENDDEVEDEDQLSNILKWTFKALTQEGKNKQSIISKIGESENYKKFNWNVNEDFFKTAFLGFSYLVPDTKDDKIQQKYYSSVFRNINIQGVALLPQESRESLYFLDNSLSLLLNPDFYKTVIIRNPSGETKSDFVRYLSLLSQYHKDGRIDRIARGYGKKMEKYYEEYIYSIVGENNSILFNEFSVIFPENKYDTRLTSLQSNMRSLDIPKQYTSIIDSDLHLFGLIYKTVIENKEIDDTKKIDIKTEIDEKIREIRATGQSHLKAPSALKYLRHRMELSIGIYNKYAKE